MRINEVVIDNTRGAGATPDNENVKYLGLQVLMRPSVFLKLAWPLDIKNQERFDSLKDYIAGGGAIGAPYLRINIPEAWQTGDTTETARIRTHEGRHRMTAIKEIEGDYPIEIHLFLSGGLRARHITLTWIKALNTKLYSEDGHLRTGPFFTLEK